MGNEQFSNSCDSKKCKNMDNTGYTACPYATCSGKKCKCGKNCKSAKIKGNDTCCQSTVLDKSTNSLMCCRGNATDNDLCPIWKHPINRRKPPNGFCGFNNEPVFENNRWVCKNYFGNVEGFSNGMSSYANF